MRKLIFLFLFLLIIQVNTAQAAVYNVNITSDKDSYELKEEAVFNIEITMKGKPVNDKKLIIQAKFPDADTEVSLVSINKGTYRFNTILEKLLEEQILNVKVFKKEKKGEQGILLAEASKAITVILHYESSFYIKEGDHTSNNEITLEIDSNASYEIAVSEDPMFTDAQWQPYAPTISFYLSSNDGEKTIYVKFRHMITQKEQVESARIILDTIAPGISILSPIEGAVVTGK